MNEEHIESVLRTAHLELRQARLAIADRASGQLKGTHTHYDLDLIGSLQRIPATIPWAVVAAIVEARAIVEKEEE